LGVNKILTLGPASWDGDVADMLLSHLWYHAKFGHSR